MIARKSSTTGLIKMVEGVRGQIMLTKTKNFETAISS